MIEKVNPYHPDKVADRISGAIVDLAYKKQKNPKIAVEILIAHGECNIVIESSVTFTEKEIKGIVDRVSQYPKIKLNLKQVPQDVELAKNQKDQIKCGDNGIFLGRPLRREDKEISELAKRITKLYPFDGKYVLDGDRVIICQSHTTDDHTDLESVIDEWSEQFGRKLKVVTINPLGDWTGGIDVDGGCTNRKLGSDQMASVSGGGVNGKDLSKADVSCNIYAFCMAQKLGIDISMSCAIGDTKVRTYIGDSQKYILIPYADIVNFARKYITEVGGFEKFSEWGLA